MICSLRTLKFNDLCGQSFNETMLKHKFPKPDFKGFMVDSAQINWNAVIIIYGLKDPSIKIVDKECTCLFQLDSITR